MLFHTLILLGNAELIFLVFTTHKPEQWYICVPNPVQLLFKAYRGETNRALLGFKEVKLSSIYTP